MKKILLIVAIVLCLAVAGTALAVTYQSAHQKNGSISAAPMLDLSLGTTEDSVVFSLEKGVPSIYSIHCVVDQSSSNAGNAQLVITVTESDTDTLDDVDIILCSDASGQEAVVSANFTPNGNKGDAVRTFTVTNLGEGTYDYYLKMVAPNNITDEALAAIAGSIDVELKAA